MSLNAEKSTEISVPSRYISDIFFDFSDFSTERFSIAKTMLMGTDIRYIDDISVDISEILITGMRAHELGEFVHNKGNIRLSHSEMLEATDHLKVHGGIDQRSTIISSQGSTHGKRCGDRFGVEHVMFAHNINHILLLR